MADEDNDNSGTPAVISDEDKRINAAVLAAEAKATRRAIAATRAEYDAYLGAQKAEADKAGMAEVDRLKVERDEALLAATAATETAAKVTASATAKDALRDAGVNSKAVADAVKLIDIAAEDIAAEVEALKVRLPALFTTIEAEAPKPPADHQPPKPPTGAGGGKSINDQAAARFARLKSINAA